MKRLSKFKILSLILCVGLLLCSCEKVDDTTSDTAPTANVDRTQSAFYDKTPVTLERDFYFGSMDFLGGKVYISGYRYDAFEDEMQAIVLDFLPGDTGWHARHVEYYGDNLVVLDSVFALTCTKYDDATQLQTEYLILISRENGSTLQKIPLDDLLGEPDDAIWSTFHMDGVGSRLVLARDSSVVSVDVTAEDLVMSKASSTVKGSVDSLGLSGGRMIAVVENNSRKPTTVEVDLESAKTSDAPEILGDNGLNPNNRFYFGSGHELLYGDENGLVALDGGNAVELMNWVNSGVSFAGIQGFLPIDDDEFMSYIFSTATGHAGLYHLTLGDASEVSEKIVINVTYLEDGRNTIPNAALLFNESQSKYHIQCNSYETSDGEIFDGFDRAILSGEIGDMVVLRSDGEDWRKYADAGLFVDLYTLMDGDATFDVGDMFGCVKEPFEIDGKLHTIVPKFTIRTLTGKAENLPEVWDTAAAVELAKSLPDTSSLLRGMTQYTATENLLMLGGASEFIDNESATCSFDSDEFVALLEYIASLPTEVDGEIDYASNAEYVDDEWILCDERIGCFAEYMRAVTRFGEDETRFVGYPSGVDGEIGAAVIIPSELLAISATSEHRDGAWEFAKFLMSPTCVVDEMRGMRYIPGLRSSLDAWYESEKLYQYYFPYGSNNYDMEWSAPVPENRREGDGVAMELTDEVIAGFVELVDGIKVSAALPTKVEEIIREEVEVFLASAKSAEDTAKLIQSRVGIYLSEKS